MSADLFTTFGVRVPDIFAGFAGGIVNALFFQKVKPFDAVASMIGGALTAAYMSAWVANHLGTDRGLSGFLVGVSAMAICQGLIAVAKAWVAKLAPPTGGTNG